MFADISFDAAISLSRLRYCRHIFFSLFAFTLYPLSRHLIVITPPPDAMPFLYAEAAPPLRCADA